MLPINDLHRHFGPLTQDLAAAFDRVLKRGWYILGPEVQAFEAEFASCAGTNHVVAVANGTDALEIGLRALGIKAGHHVATVANAGAYSTVAIRSIGAVPVYVEIDPVTLTMDPTALARVLVTTPVQVIVATHLYGRMADMPAIVEIAKEFNVPILEDCAQSHGATLNKKPAGSWGDAAAFSFYPTKNLGALGDGGAISTNRGSIAQAARELRQYGWSTKYNTTRPGGRNSRLDELQAAALRAMLPLLRGWNDRRKQIAAIYEQHLSGLDLLIPRYKGSNDVVHLYVIRSHKRDALKEKLAAAGIGADIHYPIPDYLQEGFEITPKPSLPATESWCRETLTLPCFPELTDTEVIQIATAVRTAVESN